jgi:organic radical activating enzyme
MTDQNKGDEVNADFKSKFLSDAEIAQQKLDGVSPSFCLAKWKQVSLHLTNGFNNSCYHPPLHKIPVEEIAKNPAALHNTEYKKQQREKMILGERPEECFYCWAMEDNGKLSDRHYRSGEPWAIETFDSVVSNPRADTNPAYVEVNFNNACNLECSYCSPQFSSSWARQAKEHGAYPTSTPHNDPAHFAGDRRVFLNSEENPYVDAFWKWWPDLYPELKHFRMTGGEPLMDKNTYRVFDYVLENPKPDLHLNVTSNLSVEQKLWDKYIDYVKRICNEGEKVEHFMQYVSVDGFGPQAEYMRANLDFDLMWDRVNQFLEEVPYRSSLTFIATMNNLSVASFDSFLAGVHGLRQTYSETYQRVWFDTPVLHTPKWQSMRLLPDQYAYKMEMLMEWMMENAETPRTRFKGFKDYEIKRMDRDIAWMRDRSSVNLEQDKADFYRFFSEYDRRHGYNFLETFPEMKSFWDECKYLAHQQ